MTNEANRNRELTPHAAIELLRDVRRNCSKYFSDAYVVRSEIVGKIDTFLQANGGEKLEEQPTDGPKRAADHGLGFAPNQPTGHSEAGSTPASSTPPHPTPSPEGVCPKCKGSLVCYCGSPFTTYLHEYPCPRCTGKLPAGKRVDKKADPFPSVSTASELGSPAQPRRM